MIGPGVSELWSDKQTNKQRLQLYIYRLKIANSDTTRFTGEKRENKD